jgi:hypothetical protein
MSVLGTLGIVVGLVVIALMAVAPALVDLNERFPVRERDARQARQDRSLDLRWAEKDPTFGLN